MYEEIVNLFYDLIFKYCYLKLNFNRTAAEDCTQEVFFALYKKWKSIKLCDNIKLWLYRAADIEIKRYLKRYSVNVDIEKCMDELPICDFDFSGCEDDLLNVLESEEKQLLIDYYEGHAQKEEIAQSRNISINALYLKIHRIKLKLKDAMNDESQTHLN